MESTRREFMGALLGAAAIPTGLRLPSPIEPVDTQEVSPAITSVTQLCKEHDLTCIWTSCSADMDPLPGWTKVIKVVTMSRDVVADHAVWKGERDKLMQSVLDEADRFIRGSKCNRSLLAVTLRTVAVVPWTEQEYHVRCHMHVTSDPNFQAVAVQQLRMRKYSYAGIPYGRGAAGA